MGVSRVAEGEDRLGSHPMGGRATGRRGAACVEEQRLMECGHDVLGGAHRGRHAGMARPRDRIVAYAARLWSIFGSGVS